MDVLESYEFAHENICLKIKTICSVISEEIYQLLANRGIMYIVSVETKQVECPGTVKVTLYDGDSFFIPREYFSMSKNELELHIKKNKRVEQQVMRYLQRT